MKIDEIKEKLKTMLPEKRLIHSLNVVKESIKLSKIYEIDEEKCIIAALLHDCAKYFTKEQVYYYVSEYNIDLDDMEEDDISLSHSIIGSYIAKYKFNIVDEEILNAIRYHTTGRENMSLLEKIIYIADLIEEGRKYLGLDKLREKAYNKELDEALLISFNNTIKYVIDIDKLIHPRTIKARNYILKNK
jgi:predicted HD superfamily hydrolase involved in NAD metabolism